LFEYFHQGCFISIALLSETPRQWKGHALIRLANDFDTDEAKQHKLIMDLGASTEAMAYNMAAKRCSSWVDERISQR
jgi:hypothetical protein